MHIDNRYVEFPPFCIIALGIGFPLRPLPPPQPLIPLNYHRRSLSNHRYVDSVVNCKEKKKEKKRKHVSQFKSGVIFLTYVNFCD